MAEKMSPDLVLSFLHELYSRFDQHLAAFGLWKIDTIGDAFVVLGKRSLDYATNVPPSQVPKVRSQIVYIKLTQSHASDSGMPLAVAPINKYCISKHDVL